MSENLINKIQKLREKAESANQLGNLEEANAFMSKVAELMSKYNLQESDIETQQNKDEKFVAQNTQDGVNYHKNPTLGLWDRDLIFAIARMNYCKSLLFPYFKVGIFIGKPINIEVAKYMYDTACNLFPTIAEKSYSESYNNIKEYFAVKESTPKTLVTNFCMLISNAALGFGFTEPPLGTSFGLLADLFQAIRMGTVKLSADDFSPTSYAEADKDKPQTYYLKSKSIVRLKLLADKGVFIRSFLMGVVTGLEIKFKDQIREMDEELARNNKGTGLMKSYALMLKDNEFALGEYIKVKFPGTKTFTAEGQGDANAYRNGIEKGKSTHLGMGINTGNGVATKSLN